VRSAAKLESVGAGVLIMITMMTVLTAAAGLNRGDDSGATHWKDRDAGDGKEQSKSEANLPLVHAIPHQSNTP